MYLTPHDLLIYVQSETNVDRETAMTEKPSITIHYCTQCNWLLRSAWMAQELLHTFADDLAAVTLKPGTGGVFEIVINDDMLWERKRDGGFPDAAALKQRVRDVCFPDRPLGHVDKNKS